MLISNVRQTEGNWEIVGQLGETLNLRTAPSDTVHFDIGTIGTRRRTKVSGSVTQRFAERLADLDRPVMLIDIRRSGSGGQGSWGPLELGTTVPQLFARASGHPYSYFHLPAAAPSLGLLEKWRKATRGNEPTQVVNIAAALESVAAGEDDVPPEAFRYWQVFRAAYLTELSSIALRAGQAFVEGATAASGIALFLCAEPCCPEFDKLSQSEQDEVYCHRFTFVRRVAEALHHSSSGHTIRRVDLAIDQGGSVVNL